ncbi:hypothetical protein DEU56DRAFT_810169 [Suillus clintonianus]|uniref:uncharacterized protein n=1 Tax=Suillus clintonianus TaxID=1904413 RepID=UPI001B88679E|nr:uncharacterized protein DEU56DRAFT_810169 [Suillus clintonianus]KAG2134137.1 hypothetical protein DEU56DRAFT_810169 [Suillus clintonianus]
MVPSVYLYYYLLLLCIRLLCIGALWKIIKIFVRYHVLVRARVICCSITLAKIDATHLLTLRERNIDDGWRCMVGPPSE